MREAPTWEKKKEKEKKSNRVVVVCMIVAWFCHILMSFFFLEFAQFVAICKIFMILLLLLLLSCCTICCILQKSWTFSTLWAVCKFYEVGFCFFFPLGFALFVVVKFMNFSFLPFGLHDFVCWVFFWDAWFVVWWCCILQICEGRFFSFLWVAWVCCCILLQDCEVGLWHDHNVAFCRFVKGGFSFPLGCMIYCIFLSGLWAWFFFLWVAAGFVAFCVCVNLFSSFLWVHGFLVAFCRSLSIFSLVF